MDKNTPTEEFPKLEAGSLRKGFAVIYDGKVQKILRVDKGPTTIKIVFTEGRYTTLLNDTLLEVVVKNRNERKAQNGNRKHKRSFTRK
jgi:hypothetical protein